MPSKNKPRYVEFKGEHPYFVSGECYTHKEYSDWTQQNHEDGGVMRATIKGRLYGEAFCEPKHLTPKRQFIFDPDTSRKGYTKERRERVKRQPRLESKSERLSQSWLGVKL